MDSGPDVGDGGQTTKLIGYADPLVVRPGDRVRFMISADVPSYEATVVRLIHGDENPRGPGFKEIPVETSASGTYPGRPQSIHTGSYGMVTDCPPLARLSSLTLQAWIYPTTPRKDHAQGLLTMWSQKDGAGYGLFIESDGDLAFRIGGRGYSETIRTEVSLAERSWYFVACAYDADAGVARLYQEPLDEWPVDPARAAVEQQASPAELGREDTPFLLGAGYREDSARGRVFGGELFNGKIDRPRVFNRALSLAEIGRLRQGEPASEVAEAHLVAAWDFAADISSARVTDASPNKLHGTLINMPTRAVTGHNWTGAEVDWRHAPEQYAAIHFHDDDLEDAGWEPDFEFTVPKLQSGVYAARLRAGEHEDHVPFFVTPERGQPTASIAVLMPTMTYIAYGNERMHARLDFSRIAGEISLDPLDHYLAEHPEFGLSTYDVHSDGSGVCHASSLRPIPNMRPKYRMWYCHGPEHLAGDLYLVDWLEQKGYRYDVITDEGLHMEGRELLSGYRVVITGGHPEYWSTPMMIALEEYLRDGGRVMYLGGNGFYWVTSVDPEGPHAIEVRRRINGTRSWESAPGEEHHSFNGEAGGLWRYRGRAPQTFLGIGFTAEGWDQDSPGYNRRPGGFDPRAAFIFEGVGDDEVIGDFGLALNGAAGNEIDRMDPALGTPRHALLLASSEGLHSDMYQVTPEEVPIMEPGQGGKENEKVRADMVYFEYPGGGAVFSVGSVTWMGALSHNSYDNNVSRITGNVLDRFSS